MGSQGERLKEYREYLGPISYAKMADFYGIPASTWEYNEKKAKSLAPEILDALLLKEAPEGKMKPRKAWLLAADDGPMLPDMPPLDVPIMRAEQRAAASGVTGFGQVRSGDDSATVQGVTGALPEHIQEAYKIVREALDAAKADISTMDQDQVGLVIGLAAEAIAKGNRAEARQTLLRRAEVLLGLKAP